jgi:uroporphyrinogen decarboxylase
MTIKYSSDLFLRTLAGENTPTKPIWIMRQAGRYLDEYRAVRVKYPAFMDFCRTPEAACQVTLQPLDRFELDAAILFSDILTLIPAMGLPLEFITGRGPVVETPVRTMDHITNLKEADAEKDLDYVYKAVRLISSKLDGKIPLMGFAGGPLTVASYMIEGGSSKELAQVKQLAFGSPDVYHALMEKITTLTVDYLLLQADAGADALVVMDSWAGFFSNEDYRELILPYTQRVLQGAAKSKKPVLHYANGASHLLPELTNLDCQGLGLDWRTSLEKAIELNPDMVYQGNLDPVTLFAPKKIIVEKTQKILDIVQDRPHIMNLGHGIIPKTPVSGVHDFINTIRGK